MELANIKVGMTVSASTSKNPLKRKGTIADIDTSGKKGAWITIKETGTDTSFKTRPALVSAA